MHTLPAVASSSTQLTYIPTYYFLVTSLLNLSLIHDVISIQNYILQALLSNSNYRAPETCSIYIGSQSSLTSKDKNTFLCASANMQWPVGYQVWLTPSTRTNTRRQQQHISEQVGPQPSKWLCWTFFGCIHPLGASTLQRRS